MATIAEALSIALEHQRQGRMAQAEKIYRQVLEADENNIDALHLLGVLKSNEGDQEIAVQYITRAIRRQGNLPRRTRTLGWPTGEWGALRKP